MSNECIKVRLAAIDSCRVFYCETHQVVELEVGALSLRLDIESFSTLNAVLNEATQKISVLEKAKITQQGLMLRLRNG